MTIASHRWSISFRSLLECVFISSAIDTFYPRHDHGESRGIIILLWGKLQEQKWDKLNDRWIKTSFKQLKAPAISILFKNDIHDIYVQQASLALHFYYPNLKACNVFFDKLS